MHRQILFSVISLLLAGRIAAQDYVATPEEVERFYKTTTLVVLDDNPMSEFNLIAKDVMENHWQLTPYDFIPRKDFDEKRYDERYSFLCMNPVRFEKDNTTATYNFISILLGGNERIVSNMPDLCPVPVSYYGVDEDSYSYKLGILLRFMQNHIEFIRANPNMIKENVFKRYNDSITNMAGKTLYLLKEEMAPEVNTEAKIKKIYPFPFKFVTKEQVQEAIDNADDKVVFLHKVGPEGTTNDARVYKILVGASDAKFYYFDYHKLDKEKRPDGFLADDFKKLARKQQ